MIRGETITTTLTNLPIPISEIESLYIVYRTAFKDKIEKTLEDCQIGEDSITYTLSQEESLSLGTGPVYRSAIVITKSGARFESMPNQISCHRTSKPEVLF